MNIFELRLKVLNTIESFKAKRRLKKLGFCGKGVKMGKPNLLSDYSKVLLYDGAAIDPGFTLISYTGRFIMKKNSCTAVGLTVVTGNHGREIGQWFNVSATNHSEDIEKDVVVEEDVWLGTNVTLLSGVKVGRGATVGAGAVVRTNVPPYSIVTGNPAKVVGFSLKPEEVIEHEKTLYPEEERLPLDKLEKNYKKYFLNRLMDIRNFTSL